MGINFRTINFLSRYFLYAIVFFLTLITIIQSVSLNKKNIYIKNLLKENSALREKIEWIDTRVAQLHESQDEIRSFQSQIASKLNAIDNLTAIKLAASLMRTATKNFGKENQSTFALNPEVSLVKLDLDVYQSKNENSLLLSRALYLENMLQIVPSLIPAQGYISSNFGVRIDPFSKKRRRHDGIDIAGALGTPIHSPADGVVIRANYHRDFGKKVEIRHPSGFVTRFAHMKELMVLNGQHVKQGEIIGLLGNTGKRCRGAHLHYEVQQGNKKINPKNFMLAQPSKKNV
ncbi:MAG: M23 family metallopeptidase [Myxococcales bacterium]|nr:M23 family metallopeptidase [Myxococcales bacterium]USN50119.1 MAG: M23 family metallopeptidase [Myxococcales bacterium]